MFLFIRVVMNAKPLKVSKGTFDFIENKLPLFSNKGMVKLEGLTYAPLFIPPIRGPEQHIIVGCLAVRALLFIAESISKKTPVVPVPSIFKSAAQLFRETDMTWSE